MFIEDKEYVESLMNGKPWKAGKFSYSLRCSLWSEQLGLHTGEVSKNDKIWGFMLYLSNTGSARHCLPLINGNNMAPCFLFYFFIAGLMNYTHARCND